MNETQTPETWFKSPEQRSRFSRPKPPYDRICVGSDPVDGFTEENANKFDAVVNVSCSPCAYFHPAFPGQSMHWFPIVEMGYWTMAPFYWFKKVMDFHFDRGDRIYVHCHAGAYRSPTFVIFWLTSRGHSLEESIAIEMNNDEVVTKWKEEEGGRHWKWKLRRYYESGNVNPNTIALLQRMNEHPEEALGGIHHHPGGPIECSREVWGSRVWDARMHQWFWWYYRPKWWLKEKWGVFKHYAEGSKIKRTSSFSYEVTPREGGFARFCQRVNANQHRLKYLLRKFIRVRIT